MTSIECNTVKQFIKEITPNNTRWKHPYKHYVFRGQGGDHPEILPSAHRKGNELIEKYRTHRGENTYRDQFEIEFDIICDFIKLNNTIGLHVPNFYRLVQEIDFVKFNSFRNDVGRGLITWPHEDYYPMIALAQHYQLPTCFIDWTYNPLKAAFFSGLSKTEDNETIAVYAIDITKINYKGSSDVLAGASKAKESQYRVFETDYNENEYIKSQQGLFIARIFNGIPENADFKTLGLISYCEENDIELVKIFLPIKKSEELLGHLDSYGVNYSTLFPDRTGIVQYMRTHFKPSKFA